MDNGSHGSRKHQLLLSSIMLFMRRISGRIQTAVFVSFALYQLSTVLWLVKQASMSNHHPLDDTRSAADAPPPPAAGQAQLRLQALPFLPPPRENEAPFGGMAALSLQQQSLRQAAYRSSVREAPHRRPDAASVPLGGGENASTAVADPEEHRHGGDDIHMRSSSRWTEVEAGGIPPSARSLHSTALLNGVMYIFGMSLGKCDAARWISAPTYIVT